MKIGGREISNEPNRVPLVLPRPEIWDEESGEFVNNDIRLWAQAVTDFDTLEKMLPEPLPPVAIGKGGEKVYNHKDPGYKAQLMTYNMRRLAYIIIHSLGPSHITWDTVDLEDPTTWLNYVEDFKNAGLNMIEINLVCKACMEANALDEEKLDKARQLFLRGRVE